MAPIEYRDYILIKDLYHCTPSELDKQEEKKLQLHFDILMYERKQEYLKSKRSEQK
jgi:hypothetical protein